MGDDRTRVPAGVDSRTDVPAGGRRGDRRAASSADMGSP